jgi:hypothetical protein
MLFQILQKMYSFEQGRTEGGARGARRPPVSENLLGFTMEGPPGFEEYKPMLPSSITNQLVLID